MAFGDLPNDRQTGARAFDFPTDRALKKLEDPLGMFRRHTGTAIAH
jgi:hypothetical protein